MVHQERDGAAMGTAPKTVIELFVGAYGKRRRLFVVKGAAALEFTRAGRLELHVFANNIDHVGN